LIWTHLCRCSAATSTWRWRATRWRRAPQSRCRCFRLVGGHPPGASAEGAQAAGCRAEAPGWPRLSGYAQATGVSTMKVLRLIGAIAITVPLANGPTLVGAAGPVTMALDYRKDRKRRTASPICRGFTRGVSCRDSTLPGGCEEQPIPWGTPATAGGAGSLRLQQGHQLIHQPRLVLWGGATVQVLKSDGG